MTTKRIEQLAAKLYYIENEYIRSQLSDWASMAKEYSVSMYNRNMFRKEHLTQKGYALLFMLNHICPNLQHRKKWPDARLLAMGEDSVLQYNRQAHEYETENTQAAYAAWDKYPAQDGIYHTDEEFDILMDAAAPFLGVQCFVYQDGAGIPGNLPYATVYAWSAAEARSLLLDSNTPLFSLPQWARENHWPSIKYPPNRVTYHNPKTGSVETLSQETERG